MNPLIFNLNMDDFAELTNPYNLTPQDYMTHILSRNKVMICDWLDKECGVKDWNEYEGGIDSWWGIGSVFGYELGLTYRMEVPPGEQRITITIS